MSNGEKPVRLVVKKPMRMNYGGDLGDDLDHIIPSLEITPDESIASRIAEDIYKYQLNYSDKPASIALSPKEYLSFAVYLDQIMQRGLSLGDPIVFQDIPVRPIHKGLEINLKNLTHYVWKLT